MPSPEPFILPVRPDPEPVEGSKEERRSEQALQQVQDMLSKVEWNEARYVGGRMAINT